VGYGVGYAAANGASKSAARQADPRIHRGGRPQSGGVIRPPRPPKASPRTPVDMRRAARRGRGGELNPKDDHPGVVSTRESSAGEPGSASLAGRVRRVTTPGGANLVRGIGGVDRLDGGHVGHTPSLDRRIRLDSRQGTPTNVSL
jgi:hypothetical protein